MSDHEGSDDEAPKVSAFKPAEAVGFSSWAVHQKLALLREISTTRAATIVEGRLVEAKTADVILEIHDSLSATYRASLLALEICEMAEISWSVYRAVGPKEGGRR